MGKRLDEVEPVLRERAMAPGLPRPTAMWTRPEQEPRRLPVPFINGEQALLNNWTSFRGDADLSFMHLCGLCGLDLSSPHVYMSMGFSEPTTSGPGQCLRCALLAARLCPHLIECAAAGKPVGYLWTGPGLGVADEDLQSALEDDALLRPDVIPLSLEQLIQMVKEDR